MHKIDDYNVDDMFNPMRLTPQVINLVSRMFPYGYRVASCKQRSPSGHWVCTRAIGHDGIHVAHGAIKANDRNAVLEYWHD